MPGINKSLMTVTKLHVNINKRPIGYIAQLRKQFKSMNTVERSFDYIYYKTGLVVQEEKIL